MMSTWSSIIPYSNNFRIKRKTKKISNFTFFLVNPGPSDLKWSHSPRLMHYHTSETEIPTHSYDSCFIPPNFLSTSLTLICWHFLSVCTRFCQTFRRLTQVCHSTSATLLHRSEPAPVNHTKSLTVWHLPQTSNINTVTLMLMDWLVMTWSYDLVLRYDFYLNGFKKNDVTDFQFKQWISRRRASRGEQESVIK